jgi:cobalt/nickel transport protein
MKGRMTAAVAALAAGAAQAHYGMIIVSDPMLAQEDGRAVALEISFSHPFERLGMTLERPAAFGVVANGEPQDLLDQLEPATLMGEAGFSLDYAITAPGTYIFHMEPQPYWEPAEDAFIVHYTKTYVTAFGEDEGWDAELGLKTEIVPISKPFALWAGNVFQGVVKLDGEAVPHAEVEVEYYNRDGAAVAPDELMVTQTVKADANGVFTYAAPHAGWWGFAALNTAEHTIAHEGEDKTVELGAVIWVRFEDWRSR